MAESINRDIATSISAAVKADAITSAGAVASTITVVDSTGALPLSGQSAGDRAFVTDNNYYYIHNGSGWFQIALINTTPTFTSIAVSGDSVAADTAFALSADGDNTVITLTATDAEGITVVYNATSDVGFDSLASFSQSGNTVTITPKSRDSAVTNTGTLTFTASDGVNISSAVRTFSLTFAPPVHTGKNSLFLKADNTAPTAPTDESSNSLSISTVGTQTEAFSGAHPFGLGSSYVFNGTSGRINSNANNRFDITTGDFTLEGWYYNEGSSGTIIHSAYWSGGNNRGYYLRNSGEQLQLKASEGTWNTFPNVLALSYFFPTYEWTHFSINRISGVIYTYRNGVLFNTTNYSASLNQTGGSSGNRACVIGARYSDNSYSQYNNCRMRDIIVDTGTAIRTGEFTPPSGSTGVDDQVTLTSSCKAYLMKSNPGKSWNIDHGPNALGYTFYNLTGTGYAPPGGDYEIWSKTGKGGSYYFDGTTSPYFTINQNAALALGTGDWSVELWFKTKTLNKVSTLIDARSADNQAALWLGIHSSNYVYLYVSGGTRIQSPTYIRQNIWYHIMVTRSSNVTRMFVNGNYIGQWADTTNYINSGPWYIGQRYASRTTANAAHGYMKDLRVKSVAGATDNNAIAVPTTKLTSDSNTILLVAGNTTGQIFDVTSGLNDVRADMIQGNTSASTAQTKYADANMYFDGTGDYLSVPDGTNLDFTNSVAGGAASYTLETWVYPTTLSGSSTWRTICNNGTSGNYAPMYLTMIGDKLHYLASHNETSYAMDTRTDIGSGGIHTMSANTWQHVAVTWNKNHYNFFVDGNYKGSYYKSGNPMDPNYDLGVGARDDGNEPFSGYLEDFRITKGLSRYPFIPPRETFTAITNTKLLTAHAATITGANAAGGTITVTANGDAAVSNFAPAAGMKSVGFDGDADYLSVSASSDFDVDGSSNSPVTIECWANFTNFDAIRPLFELYSGDSNYLRLQMNSATEVEFKAAGGSGGVTNQVTTSLAAGKWYHFALVKDNSANWQIFIDGSPVGSTVSYYADTSTWNLYVGFDDVNVHRYMNGYISNLRFIKGTALYSNSFTPPTEALTG